jgi:iron complex transport system substrate-binding protein
LEPDLVLVSEGVEGSLPIRRLRERGLRVFDLGPMRGQAVVEQNLRALGSLLGVPKRGELLAQTFHERLERIALALPEAARKRAVYLELYDTQLYGGTVGSSYHDVLSRAGLIDIAATRVGAENRKDDAQRAWPHFRPEDLLLLDPDVLVTTTGKTRAICNLPGLMTLRACVTRGVVEFDGSLIGDPGPGMLVAAEELFRRVYGVGLAGE